MPQTEVSTSPAVPNLAESPVPSESVESSGEPFDDEWVAEDIPEDDWESDSVDAVDTVDIPSGDEVQLQEKERPGLILLFSILILAALGGGVYLTQKYYRMYMDELMYEADREREKR